MTRFLAREGQFLLPMLDLIEQAEAAVDEVIDVVGRSAIEAILRLSACQVAGDQKGKASGDIRWYGSQPGVVALAERKFRVTKPRLRKKGKGPRQGSARPGLCRHADTGRLSQRILALLMHGISTRSYAKVLPQMAETVGVSKSQVSREWIEATEEQIKQFTARRRKVS